jgi:cell division protein FtsA
MIIDARMEELLELVDKEFARVKKSKKLPGGAVFVGGGAKLPGIAEYAKGKLELPAKIGTVKGISGLSDIVAASDYATVVGLMLLDALLGGEQQSDQRGQGGQSTSLLAKLKKIVKR